ncbi:MAG: TRAP transporter substrate-binding protein DctP [Kordiimonadaceae bacterium]|nr:TRAP transporter substrate-binding protein DctP [Kordiimonadaceae bacterium]MBO6567342.1 TRAP transporter substrate-binding protein DctP [Kordiimonadaceae bacterium]MBO6963444.1 TRAP transporter substrate-binding protein DctP [Kordiimonadaceae bacterium]
MFKKVAFGFAALAVSAALQSAASIAEDQRVKVTVGAFAAPGSPWDKDWQTFRQNAEGRSNGAIDIKLLIRGETGGEPVTMSNIRRNRIQFGGFTIGGASAIVPELSMLLTPFFFENRAELDYVMDEHLLDVFQPLFAEKNLVLVRWVEVGWLNFFGKTPILRPEDARGYALRSQASEASQVLMTSLGGDMIQMPFPDLIPALQTGLVKGGDTNMVLYGITGLGKEAPHLTLTQHAYDTGVVVANYKWFSGLSAADQDTIRNAFPTSDEARAGVRAMTQSLGAMVQADPDITVHTLSDEDRAAWVEATKGNAELIAREVGGRSQMIYDAMVAGRADYRARVAAGTLQATQRTEGGN